MNIEIESSAAAADIVAKRIASFKAEPVPEASVPEAIPQQYRARIHQRNLLGMGQQYLCLYADGNCMASAFSFAHLVMAIARAEVYDLAKPEDMEPALAGLGLTFGKGYEGSSVAQLVLDASGAVIGCHDYRENAVGMAASAVFAQRKIGDLSIDQFAKTCFFANITGSSGRVVYQGDTSAMDDVRRGAEFIWYLDAKVRAEHPVRSLFKTWFAAQLLKLDMVQRGGAGMASMKYRTDAGHVFTFVYLKGGVSKASALRVLHEGGDGI